MNKLYRVPVIVNAKLAFFSIRYIPTGVELSKGKYYELSRTACLVRDTKRVLADLGHDNFIIKVEGIELCKSQ